jgi:hypothetical protein
MMLAAKLLDKPCSIDYATSDEVAHCARDLRAMICDN